MTVAELRLALEGIPGDTEVQYWDPEYSQYEPVDGAMLVVAPCVHGTPYHEREVGLNEEELETERIFAVNPTSA